MNRKGEMSPRIDDRSWSEVEFYEAEAKCEVEDRANITKYEWRDGSARMCEAKMTSSIAMRDEDKYAA